MASHLRELHPTLVAFSQEFVKDGEVVLADLDVPIRNRLVIKRKAHTPQVFLLPVGRNLENVLLIDSI